MIDLHVYSLFLFNAAIASFVLIHVSSAMSFISLSND